MKGVYMDRSIENSLTDGVYTKKDILEELMKETEPWQRVALRSMWH